MSNWGHRLTDWAYGAGWGLVRRMPDGMAGALFRSAADLAARRNGRGTAQLRRNLARVVPQAGAAELDELVRAGLRSYARYWKETFRLPAMDHKAIYRQVDDVMVNRVMIDEALDRGKGLVIALPHTGNWDVSGIWLVNHSGPFTTVAERLRPESVFRRFLAFRESLGFEILPTSGGDVAPYRTLIERLRQNRVVCLPADRDLSRRGVPVTFFGEPTRMPAGPARLAAITGATLLIVNQSFTEDGWGLTLHTPMIVHEREQIPAVTQRMADAFAADIAANPVDWHMLQPLWISDLPDERQRVLAAAEPEAAP
ncbi:MAG TPA: phosphatidylinositol mannoside acyltransferase [Actinophytocola sp.]|uniref:phosphatidylinositol mannoside acyltransferase n=1 Tax=Actinophytocola sp. TaxID=1872138 RepID=UPI002DB68CC0|nr:phosphatidylinositol mannoside acyltransferase [Actinophytocola sp.]HEU5472874.1 phosphatidylinositol mannoside acyltransferase [Actinophytocola sp.]